MMKIANEIAD